MGGVEGKRERQGQKRGGAKGGAPPYKRESLIVVQKNAKVLPVMMNFTGMMMKNLTDIKKHPWEYHDKQTAV